MSTVYLPMQRVSLSLHLPFRTGALQFNAGHLQLVRVLQAFNLRSIRARKISNAKASSNVSIDYKNELIKIDY